MYYYDRNMKEVTCMKKVIAILIALVFCLCACAKENQGTNIEQGKNAIPSNEENINTEGELSSLFLKIVEGADTGKLVLAGEKADDVFCINTDNIPVFLDGEKVSASVLENGMNVDVTFSGDRGETFPIDISGGIKEINAYSIGSEKNPGGTYYDLAGVYLKAARDIWNPDGGLNEGAQILSICFENAPKELTEGEKVAITWILSNEFGFADNVLNLGYEELISQGYLSPYGDIKDAYWFEDGILITISVVVPDGENTMYNGLRTLKFNVTKWRSPLGAYMIYNNTAVWSQMGTWNYTEGEHAIS